MKLLISVALFCGSLLQGSSLIQNIAKKIIHYNKLITMMKYDDFTIDNHFRKLGARIGENNRIMIRTLGESPCLIKIGNHCTISSDVSFITHDGSTWVFNNELPGLQRFGTIEILDNSFIGMRSIILPNVKIGPNSVVGAGSVVTKDVKPSMIVAGNPAKEIGNIVEYKKKVLEIWEKQCPDDYLSELNGRKNLHPREVEYSKKDNKQFLIDHLYKTLWK